MNLLKEILIKFHYFIRYAKISNFLYRRNNSRLKRPVTEIIIYSEEQLKNIIESNAAVVSYYSTKDCGVCKILKPKIIKLLAEEFPKIKFVYINVNNLRELAAQNSVFSVPTVLLFVEGRETLRYSRNINLDEFSGSVGRIYGMLFD